MVTADAGLGRKYSPEEVVKYKTSWEKLCIDWLDGENSSGEDGATEESIDSDYVDDLLEADSHIRYCYELEDGEGILLWVKSETPVHVAIMRKTAYKDWVKKKITLEDAYGLLVEDITERKEMFIADENDEYTVIIANFSSEDVWIQADISIWEFE